MIFLLLFGAFSAGAIACVAIAVEYSPHLVLDAVKRLLDRLRA
ncbi:hypothetical protein FRUB_09766 [Fimbriiglobus ruber]|uniref:Uncharacterized protein n=1 Tax=Fimbriiglobus ruber TaxID=1908690 RepID=A0A225D5L4_9BACT|nr:hypothetical protein FRUB_09766 [Fimbriiglobus ruber]